jgi:Zn-dependent peptidase ImmA (M78 family)
VNFRSSESSQATNVEEIEANYFAASILMPKHLLDSLSAEEALDNDALLASLAKQFRVSRLAMSLRLANLYQDSTPF